MDYLHEPDWLINGKIDEVLLAKQILLDRQMIWTDGAFFDENGRVTDEQAIRRQIYQMISHFVSSNVSRKVENIFQVLKMECAGDLPLNQMTLHVANGTYHLIDGFTTHKYVCRHRLPVEYLPNWPEPELWNEFLKELLEEEDIQTLQEFLGYCLLPVNLGQKMLIITGRGGEGKSRIGVVMKEILGEAMNYGSIAKVETNSFARADLEHKLLMVDDDLRLTKLPTTNNLKSLITAEQPVDLERKGKQSYQGRVYARFLAFGNGSLQSDSDSSYGFFRRQIILTAKPRNPNRVDDPYLAMRLKEEINGIFMWCLSGLYRLLGSDFRFTVSSSARENSATAMGDGNNITQFLTSQGYIVMDRQGTATSKELYSAYLDWCNDNMCQSLSMCKFSTLMKMDAQFYSLQYDNNIVTSNGKRVRGFRGIRLCKMDEQWTQKAVQAV